MKRPSTKTRKPIRRKSPRRKLEQECDLLVKQALIAQRGSRCEYDLCVRTDPQAAHILPKGVYKGMRFVEENLLLLCDRHHLHFAHKNPVEFAEWVERRWPGRIERLRISARMVRKVDLKEIKAVYGTA